jgi:hypothetical protein
MAYMNQEKKSQIAAALKLVVPAGWKYSLSVRNHSGIVMMVRQAPVDILGHVQAALDIKAATCSAPKSKIEGYFSVNPYHIADSFSGDLLVVVQKIMAALNLNNYDNSDIMTDYFDVGHYVDLKFGEWDNPFLDTVPSPVVEVKSPIKPAGSNLSASVKACLNGYSGYLPIGWAEMSPGKKAAATKRAKAMAGIS